VEQAFALMLEHRRKLAGKLVVITHGLVCYALLHRHLRVPAGVALIDRFANASVSEIDAAPPYLLRSLNSTTHLEGDAADGGSIHGAA
jgi:broad specificity phosphatase PhoE